MRATRAVQEEQMSTEGLVSVVIPAYNVASHIAEAIESVLAQDYPDLEIIVVDDGSSDDTADVVASGFPRVHLIRKANGGAASARNVGIRAADVTQTKQMSQFMDNRPAHTLGVFL